MKRTNLFAIAFAAALSIVGPGAALAAPAFAAQPEPCAQVYEKDVKPPGALVVTQLWALINSERESGCILGSTDTTGIRDLYLGLHNPKPGADVAAPKHVPAPVVAQVQHDALHAVGLQALQRGLQLEGGALAKHPQADVTDIVR